MMRISIGHLSYLLLYVITSTANAGEQSFNEQAQESPVISENDASNYPGKNTGETDQASPLPELIVNARKITAPSSIILRTVSPDDISAWNAHTVGDALTYVPGVTEGMPKLPGSAILGPARSRLQVRPPFDIGASIPILAGFGMDHGVNN